MNLNFRNKSIIIACCFICSLILVKPVFAASPLKIGVISIQKVIDNSKAGQRARKVLEAKQNELQPKLMKEKKALEKEARDIEKKSSVWSADKKQATERDYQKKMRAYQIKVNDAQYTMKQLQKKVLNPIFKQLQAVINEVGRTEGLSLIFEKSKSNGLLYADSKLDVTSVVLKKMDAETAAAK